MNDETKEILEEGEEPETPETPEEEVDNDDGIDGNDEVDNEGEEEGGDDDDEAELTPEQLKAQLEETKKALAKSQAAHASNRKKQKLNELGVNQPGNVFSEYDNAIKTIDEQLEALSEAYSSAESLQDKIAIERQYRELDAQKDKVSEIRKKNEELAIIAKNLDNEGREKHDNWDQVMSAVAQIAPNEISDILESENSEVAYQKAINAISAITNLGKPVEKKGKIVKKPAPPLSKLTSTATTPVEQSPEERRQSWLARRNG